MPRPSRLKLPPLRLGPETLGQRIARIRKERGLTQEELAKRIGIIQRLVSSYERNKLRPHAEMVVRFARALEVSADAILGLSPDHHSNHGLDLRLLRRMKRIQELPAGQQRTLIRTIDTFLRDAER